MLRFPETNLPASTPHVEDVPLHNDDRVYELPINVDPRQQFELRSGLAQDYVLAIISAPPGLGLGHSKLGGRG